MSRSDKSDSSSNTRRILLAVGGGIALVGLGFLVKKLFFSSSSSASSTTNGATSSFSSTDANAPHKQQPAKQPGKGFLNGNGDYSPLSSPPPKKAADTNNNNGNGSSNGAKSVKVNSSSSGSNKNTADIVRQITELRQSGNQFFQQSRLDHALSCYQQCLDLADKANTDEARALGALALANSVMCFLKQSRWQQAEFAASTYLDTALGDFADESMRVKVLFRRATARKELGHVAEALADLRLAKEKSKEPNELVDQMLAKLEADAAKK